MTMPHRISFALALLLLEVMTPGAAWAYSTSAEISATRSFSATTVTPGQKVTVTLKVTVGAIGSSPIRGFYIADAVPDALTPANSKVTLDGSGISPKTESTSSGVVHSGCKTHRWILEEPPSWSANNPMPASSTLTVTYDVTVPSSASGTLTFPGFSWVAMIPALGDTGDHFGFEDSAATITVASQPQLALNPTNLTFSAQESSSNPSSQTVAVSNAGGGTLAGVSTQITYGTGSGWLTVTASGSGDSQSLENTVDISGLQPNTYSATVAVSASGATNSPQSYTVSLTVTAIPSTTEPTIDLQPTSLQFTAAENGSNPESQTVAVTNTGAKTLADVTTEITYITGLGWLTVTPSGSGNSQSLENEASPSGLAPDTYTATVAVSSTGASNTPQNYTVSFTVSPDPSGGDAGAPTGDGGVSLVDGGVGEGGTTNLAGRDVLVGGCAVGGAPGNLAPPLVVLLALVALAWVRRRRT
jgi:MYXO-CTERM domain-containing protein